MLGLLDATPLVLDRERDQGVHVDLRHRDRDERVEVFEQEARQRYPQAAETGADLDHARLGEAEVDDLRATVGRQLTDAGGCEDLVHREAVVAAAVRLADGDAIALAHQEAHHRRQALDRRHDAGAINRERQVRLEEDARPRPEPLEEAGMLEATADRIGVVVAEAIEEDSGGPHPRATHRRRSAGERLVVDGPHLIHHTIQREGLGDALPPAPSHRLA